MKPNVGPGSCSRQPAEGNDASRHAGVIAAVVGQALRLPSLSRVVGQALRLPIKMAIKAIVLRYAMSRLH